MTEPGPERILVMRFGALGDLVLSLGAFAAIRAHHGGAYITLLTREAFAAFAAEMPYFDDVWIDDGAKAWQVGRWLRLRRRLGEGRFTRVYDLQTSDRSGWYFRLHPRPRPAWSGIVRGCSHRHDDPARTTMHTLERQRAQLARAGIAAVPAPDLAWAEAAIDHLGLPERYAVLAPGSSPRRPAKRWPADRYAALARMLAAGGLPVVLVGTAAEAGLTGAIAAAVPGSIDLGGRTNLVEFATVLRGAAALVGNDSGPAHLAAALGRPCVALLTPASDPAKTAPRGGCVQVLIDAQPDHVVAALQRLGVLDRGGERPNVRAP